jgi:hypothetical protein
LYVSVADGTVPPQHYPARQPTGREAKVVAGIVLLPRELPMASRPHDPTDPRHLTPDHLLDEVSALLATGVRRLLASRAHSS